MAFVVQCPFCNLRARVPHRAIGAHGKCPRCAASFTLAPADDQSLAVVAQTASAAAAHEASAAESISSTAVAEAIASAAADKPTRRDDLAPSPNASFKSPNSKGHKGSLAGALALVLCGMAILCTWASKLCVLAIPLSCLGLLVGIAAVLLAWNSPRRRLILPTAGSIFSTVVLVIALLFPSLLGPTYQRSRLRGGADPTVLRAIPIGQAPLLAQVPDSVEANQYALQRGDLYVQITAVSIATSQTKTDAKSKQAPESPAKAKPAKDDLLLIRVRVQLALNEQKTSGDAKAFDWSQNRNPTLTDSAAKTYGLKETKVVEPKDAGRRSHLFPLSTTDQIFIFEAPAQGWESLRLEIPGAAWGSDGMFRFTIPATMMLSVPPGAAPSLAGGG